jgi:glutathione synthase/RimK-type ligase-like ATP-grasp enzyme
MSQHHSEEDTEKSQVTSLLVLSDANHPRSSNIFNHIVLIENLSEWKDSYPAVNLVRVKDYLSNPAYLKLKNTKVINLCGSYKYLSRGYYCSLLAEARKHRVIPSVRTIRDLSNKAVYGIDTPDLNITLNKIFTDPQNRPEDTNEVYIFFGITDVNSLKDLSREIFSLFQCPLLKIEIKHDTTWKITSIKPITLKNIPDKKEALFISALNEHSGKRWLPPKSVSLSKYDLAILHDPDEKFPPSTKTALNNFVKAGKHLNVAVELIRKKDFPKIAEFDALFIRETTAIEHHTYLFSKRAFKEGMVVIDDPDSILRCTNKVFLAELLALNKIPTPKTVILLKDVMETVEGKLDYPIVLKIPEGAFSLGVFKANNKDEFQKITRDLFKNSDILLAQEFLYTEYDWRIGILNKKPIYVSKYFMSRQHWQIYNHSAKGKDSIGKAQSFFVEDVPSYIVDTALKAANLIGDGLYGVDLKETSRGPSVIEINDNPNIDDGVEDSCLKDELYRLIIKDFIRRIESQGN